MRTTRETKTRNLGKTPRSQSLKARVFRSMNGKAMTTEEVAQITGCHKYIHSTLVTLTKEGKITRIPKFTKGWDQKYIMWKKNKKINPCCPWCRSVNLGMFYPDTYDAEEYHCRDCKKAFVEVS